MITIGINTKAWFLCLLNPKLTYNLYTFLGFRVYTQHALHLGAELRLPEYKFCQPPEDERNLLALTWAHIMHMQQTLVSTARSPAPGQPARHY
jgi:hypothetical protein